MNRRSALLAAMLAAAALAACSAPATLGPENLVARTFLSTAVEGRALVAGSRVRVSFKADTLTADAGCNTMSGPYTIDGTLLHTSQLAMTEMGCDAALMDQDQWLAAHLDGPTITLDGHTLTLTHNGIRLTLVDRQIADPDRPLLGTRWVLDGLVSGDAVSSVPVGITAALTFSDGRVAVEAGCNTGTGSVTITDTTLTFGPIGLTKMACGAAAMAVERALIATLAVDVGYTIEAGTLTVDGGANGLILRAEP